MNSVNYPVHPLPGEMVVTSELVRKAFISHGNREKRTVVDLLLRELQRHGIGSEKVFYDDSMEPGSCRNGKFEDRLGSELLASEFLVVFLTPKFLKDKKSMWELRMFLDMREKDARRELLPIFYGLSAKDCDDIVKQGSNGTLESSLGLTRSCKAFRRVLRKVVKVKDETGIDAEGLSMPDSQVVTNIMKLLFGTSILNVHSAVGAAKHRDTPVATCNNLLCDHTGCLDRVTAAEISTSILHYTAFLSHEGTEKRTVVSLLRTELHRHGIEDSKVFYDDYMKRGSSIDDMLRHRLMKGLVGSKILIAFLSRDFLKKPWTMWELWNFRKMMEIDPRRKLLPVFYRVSPSDFGAIIQQEMGEDLKKDLGLNERNIEGFRQLLLQVKSCIGIDAECLRLSDTDVVKRIMKDVFSVPRDVPVFLSCAREDKWSVGGCLRKELELRFSSISCSIDEEDLPWWGFGISNEQEETINNSKIGIFVLSPEFLSKYSKMRELEQFLRRCEKADLARDPKPLFYPVFYGLSVVKCKEEGPDNQEKEHQGLEKNSFFIEQQQKVLSTEKTIELLQRLSKYSGSHFDGKTYLYEFAADVVNKIATLAQRLPEVQINYREA